MMKRVLSPTRRILLLVVLSSLLLVCGEAAQAAIAPAVTQTLPNGAILVTRSDKVAPRVAISLLIRAGAADESAATAGWRQVLTGAMLHATRMPDDKIRVTSDWQRLAEGWGGQFGATSGEDFIELWARGDSAFAPQLLQALLQIATSPRLSDDDIAWARRRALQIVGQPEGGVARRAGENIARSLYRDAKGAPLAYALPDYGTFDSLSNLSNEQVRALHANFFTAPRIIVSAAGDVNAAALHTVIEKAGFSATQAEASTPERDAAPAFAPLKSGAPPLTVREMGASGAWVFVAFRTPAINTLPAADYAALQVLAAALSDSSQARLPRRLTREKTLQERRDKTRAKEIATQAAAQWTPRRWAGELVLLAQTDTQNVDAVKNALLDEVNTLRTASLSSVELQAAQNFARGQWAEARELPRERAFQAALPVTTSTFPDTDWPQNIAAVTAADVQRAAQKYLQAYAVVLILPEE